MNFIFSFKFKLIGLDLLVIDPDFESSYSLFCKQLNGWHPLDMNISLSRFREWRKSFSNHYLNH